MAVTPPASFYLGPDATSPALDITGVRSPLRVRTSNIQLVNAAGEEVVAVSTTPISGVDPAKVILTAQGTIDYVASVTPTVTAPIAYVGGSLMLVNSDAATVTAISTDPALASDSDTSIPTQHAVKEYVDTHGGAPLITAVNLPLYMNLTTLNIHDASPAFSGVVTMVAQVFSGAKTFMQNVAIADITPSTSHTTGALTASGGLGIGRSAFIQEGISLSATLANPYIRSTTRPLEIYSYNALASPAVTAFIRVNSLAYGGILQLYGATGASLTLNVGTTLGATLTETELTAALPVTVPHLRVFRLGSSDGLSVTVDGSGSTAITTTGALTINGHAWPPYTETTVVHTLRGAISGSTVTVRYQRMGSIVSAAFAAVQATASATATIYFDDATPIPDGYRPLSPGESMHVVVINLGSNATGRYAVLPNGSIIFYSGIALQSFNTALTAGWYAFTTQWRAS